MTEKKARLLVDVKLMKKHKRSFSDIESLRWLDKIQKTPEYQAMVQAKIVSDIPKRKIK